jgi:hypothetical protein
VDEDFRTGQSLKITLCFVARLPYRYGMKALLPVGLVLVVLAALPAQASRRSECRQTCGSAINACQDACSSFKRQRCRTKCRKSLVRACVQQGAAACDLAPPTTTTTTTTTTTVTQPTTTTTLPTSRLSLLIGHWAFTYTITSTFTDNYNLTSVQLQTTTTGGSFYGVVGTNTDLGNQVLAARIHDVDPGNTLPYEFALLDPEGFSLCEFFVFNLVGASTAQGEVLYLDGECQNPLSSTTYTFSGSKY